MGHAPVAGVYTSPQWRKRRTRLSGRQDWFKEQKSKPCMDCGGQFPPECMDFDHVRGEKSFNVSKWNTKSWRAILDEIAKCDLVCANCHRIRTEKRRTNRASNRYPKAREWKFGTRMEGPG